MEWIQNNWIAIMGVLWGIDQILKVIAPLTKNKVDDNLADMLGKLLTKFSPKKDV